VFGVLGLLTALTAGFAAWSGVSGPANADVQVHAAAANVLAAPSLVIAVTSKVSILAGDSAESSTLNETIDYQSPDRLYVSASASNLGAGSSASSGTAHETQIGASCWESGFAAGSSCSAGDIHSFFSVVRDLEKAKGVRYDNGTYFLSGSASEALITDGLSGGPAPSGVYSVELRVQGDVISWEQLSVAKTAATVPSELIVLRFEDVGHGPAVKRPPGPPDKTG
jgi:hypothetical protein